MELFNWEAVGSNTTGGGVDLPPSTLNEHTRRFEMPGLTKNEMKRRTDAAVEQATAPLVKHIQELQKGADAGLQAQLAEKDEKIAILQSMVNDKKRQARLTEFDEVHAVITDEDGYTTLNKPLLQH